MVWQAHRKVEHRIDGAALQTDCSKTGQALVDPVESRKPRYWLVGEGMQVDMPSAEGLIHETQLAD